MRLLPRIEHALAASRQDCTTDRQSRTDRRPSTSEHGLFPIIMDRSLFIKRRRD
jgi:hypothetical protein